MFYFYLFIVILIMLILGMDKRISIKVYTLCPLVLMTLVIGMRYQTGRDLSNYAYVYESLKNHAIIDIEISYIVIAKILLFFRCEFQAIVLVYAVLSFGFIYFSIKNLKMDKLDIAMFVVFFYTFAFTTYFVIMRQFLAAAIIMYAFTRSSERQNDYWITILWLILASFVHTGAVLILIIYLILSLKIWNNNLVIMLALAFAYFISKSKFVIQIIEDVVGYFPRYAYYLLKDNFGSSEETGITMYCFLIVYLLLLVYDFFCKREFESKQAINRGLLITFGVFAASLLLGYFNRAYWYTMPFVCLLPYYFRREWGKKDWKICIVILIICVIYALYIYANMQKLDPTMLPYRFSLKIW